MRIHFGYICSFSGLRNSRLRVAHVLQLVARFDSGDMY